MPHDVNGKLLQPGDKVILRGTVKEIFSSPDSAKYCNLTVELDVPMPAYPESKTALSGLNASQAEKVE